MYCGLNQGKWVFSLVNLQQKLDSVGWWTTRLAPSPPKKKKNKYIWQIQIKIKKIKPLWIQFRKLSNRIPKIYCNWITGGNSLGQTVLILDWKWSPAGWTHELWKKKLSYNLLVKVDNKKYVKNLIKMKTLHNLKCTTYLHKKLNSLKRVIRHRELSLDTPEEIQTALRKHSVTDYKKITIKKGGEEINTCINFDIE